MGEKIKIVNMTMGSWDFFKILATAIIVFIGLNMMDPPHEKAVQDHHLKSIPTSPDEWARMDLFRHAIQIELAKNATWFETYESGRVRFKRALHACKTLFLCFANVFTLHDWCPTVSTPTGYAESIYKQYCDCEKNADFCTDPIPTISSYVARQMIQGHIDFTSSDLQQQVEYFYHFRMLFPMSILSPEQVESKVIHLD